MFKSIVYGAFDSFWIITYSVPPPPPPSVTRMTRKQMNRFILNFIFENFTKASTYLIFFEIGQY